MQHLDAYNILSYGVIGLGFLLAFLAYRLLGREQQNAEPRRSILVAIHVFMIFSVVLCIIGFGSEYLRSRPTAETAKELNNLRGQLDQQKKESDVLTAKSIQQELLIQRYQNRQSESLAKNKKIIDNLTLLAKLPLISEGYRQSLIEAIESLRQPIVKED